MFNKKLGKEIQKKEDKQDLIIPIQFDKLNSINGEKIEVVSYYSAMNQIYDNKNDLVPNEMIYPEQLFVRRKMLTEVFKNRVEFLLNISLNVLSQELEMNGREFFNIKDTGTDWGKYLSLHDIDKDILGNITNIKLYAPFNDYITPLTVIDIITMITSGLYNKFTNNIIRRMTPFSYYHENGDIKFNLKVLDVLIDPFMRFQIDLFNIFTTLFKEIETVYGPAGFPDLELELDDIIEIGTF